MKTSSILICLSFLVASLSLQAQSNIQQSVSVNSIGEAAHASAQLDVSATDKGVLVPRMTSAQRTAIASPATGLLVFDTSTGGFWFFNGTAWTNISAPSVLADADNDTKIQVEESPDEDVIRFDLAGTENMVLQKNAGGSPRLELPNALFNTFVGMGAGAANTTGTDNTAIGSSANFASGNLTNATVIGANATANCSNCTVLGGTGPATTNVGIGTATPTSRLHINGVGYGMSHTHNDIGLSTYVDADAMLKAGWFGTYSNHPLFFYTNDNTVPNMALMQQGNTGIGTATPDASALLDLSATNRGMLVPRMTSAQRTAIASPATGLLVYDTDTNAFWFHNGSAWAKISPQTVLADADNDTKIQVEESANENIIRFDLAGTEHLVLRKNAGGTPRLELLNSMANTAVGNEALLSNTTGSNNMAIGMQAGIANTTGSNNTAIGSFANFAAGNLTNATAIGYNASVNCSNCMVLGGTGADAVKVGIGRNPGTNVLEVEGDASKSSAGDWLANSDARLKKNISPLNSEQMLEKMLALQGVSYEWDDDKTGSDRPEGAQFGFTAQNVQTVFPSLVQEDNLGYLQTAYGTYDAMTVEAIRALNEHLISVENKTAETMRAMNEHLTSLENKIAALEQQSKQLGEENAALQSSSQELVAKLQNMENRQAGQGQK